MICSSKPYRTRTSAAPGEKPEQFYGVEEDVRSVGQFIRLGKDPGNIGNWTANNPAFANNPQQFVTFFKIAGIAGAIFSWAISTSFAVLIYFWFRKPVIVAAFERPPEDPTSNLPPPLM